MLHLIFVKRNLVCHAEGRNVDPRVSGMISDALNQFSIESYVTSRLHKGYYVLAQDRAGRWYCGTAHDKFPDFTSTLFHGPCFTRGEAIAAGEDWVERSTSG